VHERFIAFTSALASARLSPQRFEAATVTALDAWAVAHAVSRSETIRRLVEIGLKAKAATQ
jgi:hypothetical protein